MHATLKPSLASYLGVYEPGVPASYQPVDAFAKAAGRRPNLVGYFSGWAQPFNRGFAATVHRHGAIPFVQIDPTGASVDGIAAGDYDDYLRSYAEAVRDYGQPVVIGFGHEMNAPWYSWGYGHVSPATFVAAWRHLVTVFRGMGADNVTWLWTIQADARGTGPIGSWWPGSRYVSWVGIDGFYYSPSDTFDSVFGPTLADVHALTNQPVLLSETAVGPAANQFGNILRLFQGWQTAGRLAWSGSTSLSTTGRTTRTGGSKTMPWRRTRSASGSGRTSCPYLPGTDAMDADDPRRPPAGALAQVERARPEAVTPAPGPRDLHGQPARRRAIAGGWLATQWPLLAVLGTQAALSLRLVWANTAFQDEALYLRAGHLEWARWLHGAVIPDFPSYFSGAPVIYPPLAALADDAGGLAAARVLSLCFMLGVTTLLWATTGRLYGKRAGLLAAGLFATLAGTQFLGAFATYDALALLLLALAAWLTVRSADCSERARFALLVLAGATLAVADTVTYATALFTPVVLVDRAAVAWQRDLGRTVVTRAARDPVHHGSR